MSARYSGYAYIVCTIAAVLFLRWVAHWSWWLAVPSGLVILILFIAFDPFTWVKKTPPQFEVGEYIIITTPRAEGSGPILNIRWDRKTGWHYLVKDSLSSSPDPHWVHEGWLAR